MLTLSWMFLVTVVMPLRLPNRGEREVDTCTQEAEADSE